MNYVKSCLSNCQLPCPEWYFLFSDFVQASQAVIQSMKSDHKNPILCSGCVNCAYRNNMYRACTCVFCQTFRTEPLLVLLLSVLLTCGTFCPPCPRGQSRSREPEWWRCIPSAARSPPGHGPSADPRQTYRSAPLLRTAPPAHGCWTHRSPLETRKKGGRGGRRKERTSVLITFSQVEYRWRISVCECVCEMTVGLWNDSHTVLRFWAILLPLHVWLRSFISWFITMFPNKTRWGCIFHGHGEYFLMY